jgi:hypothetical protein
MIQLAFYRGGPDERWVDLGIKVFSGLGEFCHAELVFSDGVSFSSTARDPSLDSAGNAKPDGTRFKRIDYSAHPERWMLIPVGMPHGYDGDEGYAADEAAIRAFALSELDARYDYAGCFRFVVPFWRESPANWFCSEIVTACLQQVDHPAVRGLTPWRVSPNELQQRFCEVR